MDKWAALSSTNIFFIYYGIFTIYKSGLPITSYEWHKEMVLADLVTCLILHAFIFLQKNPAEDHLHLTVFLLFFPFAAQIFDTQCRRRHQGHQAADHEGPRCSGELIIGSGLGKGPLTVNVSLRSSCGTKPRQCWLWNTALSVFGTWKTQLTADLLWHIWCDVILRCSAVIQPPLLC